uniref:(northern house mosquito) hypothetical protein n=1 Tax=Culex pipiens TaxID=7175 RepID=A0A8D8B0U7_CULPI
MVALFQLYLRTVKNVKRKSQTNRICSIKEKHHQKTLFLLKRNRYQSVTKKKAISTPFKTSTDKHPRPSRSPPPRRTPAAAAAGPACPWRSPGPSACTCAPYRQS